MYSGSKLVKSSAYLNRREQTTPIVLLVLKNCLWSTLEDKKSLEILIEKTEKNILQEKSKSNINDDSISLIEQMSQDLESQESEIIISSGALRVRHNIKKNFNIRKYISIYEYHILSTE
ncbi:MAG: hypothetical protein IJ671_04260 [Succinivibrio sp.]|nr:hypothetical protein [Succinivibrio sp.]